MDKEVAEDPLSASPHPERRHAIPKNDGGPDP